jgi:hypothetical protein
VPVVGIICEGRTDAEVLRPLLEGLLGVPVDSAYIQPPDVAGAFAGWAQAFASLRRRDVSNALTFVDAVVVHVDTDVCEEPGFDISRRVGDRARTHEELAVAVEERLRAILLEADPDVDLSRVAFAVSVNSIECWLLLSLDPKTTKDTGCLAAANACLARQDRPTLGSKDPRAYATAARELRKAKVATALVGRSRSFDRVAAAVWALP